MGLRWKPMAVSFLTGLHHLAIRWPQPRWGCADSGCITQGSSCVATLGFEPESLWDSFHPGFYKQGAPNGALLGLAQPPGYAPRPNLRMTSSSSSPAIVWAFLNQCQSF